ncbi:MAG TPA: DegT/DnrJ/EryC1/StrS family aminotransferase [Candidatus Limnocylindrales bacterium]|nr:DegT/DnrJ/EryC1/StrS family aminotransferase [Candidatus Limnocylindrales bacterium]
MTNGADGSPLTLAFPDISDLEIELVSDVLRSGTLALGPFAQEFEQRIADLTGRKFAISCSSGTAGLHLAIRALDIGEGDDVITTPFSFVASANCALYERANVVFADIEEETLGIDPDQVAARATDATRAVIPVDVFGNACQIERLQDLASDRGWRMIEDSCEGLGTISNGRQLGSFGDISVFAFYPNKQITTGEGGMVLTDDPALAETLWSLRNQGRDSDTTWLRHIDLGYNYRLDELSAALGVAQLRRFDELVERRSRVAGLYDEALGGIGWITLPHAAPAATVNWFVYVIQVDPGIDRDELARLLAKSGVPTRPYFSTIHLQPYYRSRFGYKPGDFPVAERVASRTLALPFWNAMTESQVGRVADALRTAGPAAAASNGS